jgi:hypothetical protein
LHGVVFDILGARAASALRVVAEPQLATATAFAQVGFGVAAFTRLDILAEGVGFEPTVPLQARRFSRPVP